MSGRKRILVTRAREQAGEFAALLEASGLEPVIFPVIEFAPPEDKEKVLKAIQNITTCDWLLLTSSNGVKFFLKYLQASGKALLDLEGLKVCAVGPRTARTAKESGIHVDLIPDNFQAEGVLEAFRKISVSGKNILFPRAEEGREVLPRGLDEMGAKVDLVHVYRTVKPEGKEDELKAILEQGIDVITFTSGSTVRNFLDILKGGNLTINAKIACISQVTADLANRLGLKTDILPEKNTTKSLAEALEKHFR